MAEPWSSTQEEEEAHRQRLFRKARRGDEKATLELQEVYGVRLWAEHERAELVYENPRFAKRSNQKLKR